MNAYLYAYMHQFYTAQLIIACNYVYMHIACTCIASYMPNYAYMCAYNCAITCNATELHVYNFAGLRLGM